MKRIGVSGSVLLLGVLVALPARAQTDESMLLKPWEENQVFEGSADGRFYNSGTVEHQNEKSSMIETQSQGRFRLSTKYPIDPTIGYDYTMLSFDGRNMPVPNQLNDLSVGAASPVGLIGDWFIGLSAAVGYAGDSAFGDRDAWYGKGSIMTGKELSKDSAIIGFLDYNGNRSIYPDIPLPGIAYHKTEGPDLEWVIGSVESVTWKPVEHLELSATYQPLTTANVSAEYGFKYKWAVFIIYQTQEQAFHTQPLPEDHRLFYTDQHAELGFRYQFCKDASMTIAGGYAFLRELRTGFDDRDLDLVAKMSDEPYLRVGLGIEF